MDLLTAVNRILPVLGEHPVTSVDAKHPTLGTLLPKVETKIEDITLPGYWFNTFDYTFYPDPMGGIAIPGDVLSFVPENAAAIVRGKRLFNPLTMTYVFPAAVTGRLITRVPFEELPESVASLVWYSTLVDAYITDIGLEPSVREWQRQAADAERRVVSEHLRNMRYSTTKTARFARYKNALRS